MVRAKSENLKSIFIMVVHSIKFNNKLAITNSVGISRTKRVSMAGKLYSQCNEIKLNIEIELCLDVFGVKEGIGSVGAKYSRELDFVTGKKNSTLLIGYSKGFIDLPEGTIAAHEVKIEAGAFVEDGKITDACVKAEGKVETDVKRGWDWLWYISSNKRYLSNTKLE
jgi:hypothetical protein